MTLFYPAKYFKLPLLVAIRVSRTGDPKQQSTNKSS
jgi:hypothetical protein